MSTLIEQYAALTAMHAEQYGERTLVLLQVGAFFEVYGMLTPEGLLSDRFSRIAEFSQVCELNVGDKKMFNAGLPPQHSAVVAGFKDFLLDKYVKKLQDAGFTIAIYVEDASGKKDDNNNLQRSLSCVVSPGTFVSSSASSASSITGSSHTIANHILCVWLEVLPPNQVLRKPKQVAVGAASVDVLTGQTHLFQFVEPYAHNPTTYDELERFCCLHPPTEWILITNELTAEELQDVVRFVGVEQSVRLQHIIQTGTSPTNRSQEQQQRQVRNCEKQAYQLEILRQFYPGTDPKVLLHQWVDNVIATQAFCFLLDFVYQHNPQLVARVAEPVFDTCTDRLVLANHSLKQLNLIDDHAHSGKLSSVVRLLNDCLTPMGRRRFQQVLLHPTTRPTTLQRHYDITDHVLQSRPPDQAGAWTQALKNITDLSLWLRQIHLGRVSPSACCKAHQSFLAARDLWRLVRADPILLAYVEAEEHMSAQQIATSVAQLCDFISSYLVLDVAAHIDNIQRFDTNFFQRGISKELDALLDQQDAAQSVITRFQTGLNELFASKEKEKEKKKSVPTEFVKWVETDKTCSLQVTQRRSELIRSSGLLTGAWAEVHFYRPVGASASSKDVVVSHPALDDAYRQWTDSKLVLKEVLQRTFQVFLSVLAETHDKIDLVIKFVTAMDVLHVRATMAQRFHYCRPQLEQEDLNPGKSFVQTTGLRHCLIERLQTGEPYVTNDITLGDGVTDGVLLYGTNAVGKTSIIRALGIAVVMAQAGFYVPATTFRFRPYRFLFTRILANDNLFRGLSSFAVEMLELRTILRRSNQESLILGDELCSTTETCSAISIFVTGIQHLHANHSSFIFATHLHEIVHFPEVRDLTRVHLKHLEVTYDRERDRLIYDRKLREGPGHCMYGLEVCKALHLPPEFLASATALRQRYFPETASLLSLRTSHYNARKLLHKCEECGIHAATEVHHVLPQRDANDEGWVQGEVDGRTTTLHKNDLGNLRALCEACHSAQHHSSAESMLASATTTTTGHTATALTASVSGSRGLTGALTTTSSAVRTRSSTRHGASSHT